VDPVILYSVGALALIAGGSAVILFFVAKKFKVDEDPRIGDVTELLPGANCGGCGFPGCSGFATALVKAADNGDLAGLACPPGGNDTMSAVGNYLGMTVEESAPTTAVVRCNGTKAKAPSKLTYEGPSKCAVAHTLFSGENGCPFGCLGLGDCVVACDYDAIYMDEETGLPVVIPDKCTSCGACVKACPRNIIEIRPRGRKDRRVWVACMNEEKGPIPMKNCKATCISCGKCFDVCPPKVSAITIENNLAFIDSAKCIACGLCIPVCPTNAILATFEPPQPKPKTEKKEEAEVKE
jgi:electron transport complex protein RnfB